MWEGSDDPLAYLCSVINRGEAVHRWVGRVDQGTLLREPLDLAELFNPERFINALRQQTAR